MFERLYFNLYLVRLEYFPYQKKFKARLFTSSGYGIATVGSGSRFDLGKSLKSGILFFDSEETISITGGTGIRHSLKSKFLKETFLQMIIVQNIILEIM